jgi:hypothetical protein
VVSSDAYSVFVRNDPYRPDLVLQDVVPTGHIAHCVADWCVNVGTCVCQFHAACVQRGRSVGPEKDYDEHSRLIIYIMDLHKVNCIIRTIACVSLSMTEIRADTTCVVAYVRVTNLSLHVYVEP